MLTTFIIGLREYLEVFLIIGIFLGLNKKLLLKKEKEIFLASLLGISLSILLPIIFFYYNNLLKNLINKKYSEIFEGFLMIFSGIFISYIIFSLHNLIHKKTNKKIKEINKNNYYNNFFDLSLFLLIIFFILREGFEIALFTSTTSYFYTFYENIIGLLLSFSIASIFGILTFFGFSQLSIKKIFKFTEWLLILLGGSMIINGINELLEGLFNSKISYYLPIYLNFLPEKDSFLGHFLKTFFTLKQEYSFIYVIFLIFYFLLIKKIMIKSN